MRVDGKSNTYTVESPPESFVAFPKIVNFDFFPNIRKLSLIETIFPIRFLEAEKTALEMFQFECHNIRMFEFDC